MGYHRDRAAILVATLAESLPEAKAYLQQHGAEPLKRMLLHSDDRCAALGCSSPGSETQRSSTRSLSSNPADWPLQVHIHRAVTALGACALSWLAVAPSALPALIRGALLALPAGGKSAMLPLRC